MENYLQVRGSYESFATLYVREQLLFGCMSRVTYVNWVMSHGWIVMSRVWIDRVTHINEMCVEHVWAMLKFLMSVRSRWPCTAIHCNTLQHAGTHCNTLRHTATRWDTPQHTATHCNPKRPCLKPSYCTCEWVTSRIINKSLLTCHVATPHVPTSPSCKPMSAMTCWLYVTWLSHSTHKQEHDLLQSRWHCMHSIKSCHARWLVTSHVIICHSTHQQEALHITHYNALQRAIMHCNTLQHTATHYQWVTSHVITSYGTHQ